jgi:hypothetical protein
VKCMRSYVSRANVSGKKCPYFTHYYISDDIPRERLYLYLLVAFASQYSSCGRPWMMGHIYGSANTTFDTTTRPCYSGISLARKHCYAPNEVESPQSAVASKIQERIWRKEWMHSGERQHNRPHSSRLHLSSFSRGIHLATHHQSLQHNTLVTNSPILHHSP